LIDTIYKNYKVVDNPEITLEANPDDLMSVRNVTLSVVEMQSRTIFENYKNIGINRLSIGIQSFFEADLKAMNRAHSAKEAKQCLEEATKHFDNITVDLIYGIPNMSNKRWEENLQTVFDFGINHISSYALTVEPKTALANFIKQGKYPNVDEELAEAHFKILIQKTSNQDFIHYEISNFGKQNYFSKHNTSYWQGKSYLGIGPSAHSFNGTERSWNVSNNTKYIKSIQKNELPNEVETLSEKDQFNEYIMTGLRTIWGISLEKVEQDFGSEYKEQLLSSAQRFINQGLLIIGNCHAERSRSVLKTTQKGKFLVDGISSYLFMI
jgi:oxygen-independent coproporphyrinogen-3 oxidase